jgi:PAS domain S-box-containing protein
MAAEPFGNTGGEGYWTEFDGPGLCRELVQAAGDGLLVVDREGAIRHAQGVASDVFGAGPGQHAESVLPQLWPKLALTLLDRKRRTELAVRAGGVSYLAWMNHFAVGDRTAGALCLFIESTGMDELVAELDAIIDSSSDGLWICDADATVIRVNPASERINKIQAAEVVGRKMEDLLSWGFVDRSAALEAIRTRQVVSLLQRNHNGRKLISTGTPVFDVQGNLFRAVVSERDITEVDNLQRELEEQQAIRDQFRHQIVEMQQASLEARRIIAKSPGMLKALKQALKVSQVDSSVLILGESGVGKGLIADLIHKNSARAEKPMIRINCGAIPESLIESELFGYEKGAFTGAQAGKPGYLELADGGILFLDEIAELPLASQVKLLRFLEDGRVTRLGGTKPHTVDVRILAATHRDLEEMVHQEKFRLDLYYRLNVIPLYIPAVRERQECILPLIRHYLEYFAEKNGLARRLTMAATDVLLAYSYPGNVRELMNICERLVVMSETELIDLKDLPTNLLGTVEKSGGAALVWPEEMSLPQAVESLERSVLLRALDRFRNQCLMAEALGVTQATIARKLKRYGIGRGMPGRAE